ncbi:MAG: hypothetical protein BroJett030_05500 [Alphaproteobacteria bacterium]|nr:MAG: hypothetical protein BroJett030_05500 [Alphaproteobacteria bacterium]
MVKATDIFKPQAPKGQSKASATDRAYREIVIAEAQARKKKTERLRQARREQEALSGETAEKPAKPRSRKPARTS